MMNRNKVDSIASSFSRRRMPRKVLRFWMINPLVITIIVSVLLIQSVAEAFNSQGSPLSPDTTVAETFGATRPTVNRIGAFSQGSHRNRSGQDREHNYQHNGKRKINKIDHGYAKGRAEEDLQRLERDKHSIRPLKPLTRDLQIQSENEQSLQSLEKEYSVPLVFSLWLGTKNTDDEEYTTAISSFNIAELENATNPIHTSVVQSLWQLLCTRPDIQLLGDGEDTDIVSPQEAVEAMEADACINLLPGNQRRFQPLLDEEEYEEEEAASVLRQTPILVKVELRQEENATWTEWTTVFQVERIGDRYMQLAWQENAAFASAAGDQENDSFTPAAVEIMRESLQLLLDIAILAGPMNQVIQERLRSNSLLDNAEKSTVSTMATEASPYNVLSSPVGGELQAFPAGIPNAFSDKSNATVAGIPPSSPAATKSRRQPNTFDVSILNVKRIVGFSLFILTIAGYATMLHLSRKQARTRLQENGGRISATEEASV